MRTKKQVGTKATGVHVDPEFAKKAKACEPARVWMSVPAEGIVLKLIVGESTNPNHVFGTLRISRTGVMWLRSNAKKRPERELTWDAFRRLLEAGIL